MGKTGRREITVICEKCGLPGTGTRKLKYPHEECRLEVKRAGVRSAHKKRKETTGLTEHQIALNNMTQNKTILANRKQEKKRTCIKCNKKFKSRGSGNRICDKCNTANANVIQPARAHSVLPAGKRAG